jgi:hypothetical protein
VQVDRQGTPLQLKYLPPPVDFYLKVFFTLLPVLEIKSDQKDLYIRYLASTD